jgi:hypothetical protein
MATESTKKCEHCGHSRAAHTDGVQCALCRCQSQPRTLLQESFAFRDAIPLPTPTSRKR